MLFETINKLPIDTRSHHKRPQFNSIELFAGIGGLALGSQLSGFNHVLACEKNPVYAYSFHANFCQREGTILQRDAAKPLSNEYSLPDDIDLLTAGPPCKPYSTARGDTDDNDPRSETLYYPIRWAKEYRPKVILIENVPNLKHKHDDKLARFKAELDTLGYQTKEKILNAADYLVPQARKRLFIVAVHESVPTPSRWFPAPLASEDGATTTLDGGKTYEWRTCADALDDLPTPIPYEPPNDDPVHRTMAESPVSVEHPPGKRVNPFSKATQVRRDDWSVDTIPANHVASDHDLETRKKYSEYRLGYSNDDNSSGTTGRRLHPAKPAPAITASNGTPPVHYVGRSPQNPDAAVEDVRRLTAREVARVQTFPDGVIACGTVTEQRDQFAHAVPPLLGFILTTHIREHILTGESEQTTQMTGENKQQPIPQQKAKQ